ncbi:sigma-70 family RNA polymerase sigma factor, partial [Streptomyces sp. NPDC048629]
MPGEGGTGRPGVGPPTGTEAPGDDAEAAPEAESPPDAGGVDAPPAPVPAEVSPVPEAGPEAEAPPAVGDAPPAPVPAKPSPALGAAPEAEAPP